MRGTTVSGISSARLQLGVALAITGLLIVLHFSFMFHAGALWRDEVNTVQLATMPSVAELWDHLQYDSFPVLWPLVLRSWASSAGDSDGSLRILGLLVGLSLGAALWWLAQTVTHSAPTFSIVLFALSAAAIRYGDSMRAYGFGILLGLLNCGMIWKLARAPTGPRAMLALAVAVLSVHSLYYNSILLFAFGLGGMMITARRRLWKRTVLIGGVGLVAALSLIPYASTMSRMDEWMMLVQLPISLHWIWIKISETISISGPLMIYAWVSLFGLALVSAAYLGARTGEGLSEREKDVLAFSTTSLVVGTLGYLAFLKSLSYFTQPWYYLALLALIAVCVDMNLNIFFLKCHRKWVEIALVLLLIVFAFESTWVGVRKRQTNIDLIASTLENSAEKEDLILLTFWFSGVSFSRYYSGSTRWITLPDIEDHRVHRYDQLKAKMASEAPIEDVVQAVRRTLQSGRRLWIVGVPIIPPPGETVDPLPPAPHPKWGWMDWPYTNNWSSQMGQLLRDHTEVVQSVRIPLTQPVNQYENLDLLVARGWRDE